MNKQIYYHFLSSEYAVEDLKDERIKVGLISELNDPFELLPYLRYNVFEERNPYHKVRATVSKKYGLLCFSKKWEEPLLWGHYANKHGGVAIGFEILKDEVLDVEYIDKRPKFKLTNSQEKNEKLFLDLAKTKYKKWSYEEESRVLIKLEECEFHEEHPFLSFPNRLAVKEIILGSKFDKNELENIGSLAKNFNAEVILARLNWGEYKIVKDGGKTSDFKKRYL